jgi:hypothetical protein
MTTYFITQSYGAALTLHSVKRSTGLSLALEEGMKNNHQEWPEWILRVVLLGIAGFAVSYLKDIGRETASLSTQFLELKYEIKRLAENQIEMNTQFANKLEKIDQRVNDLERKGAKR